MQVHSLLNKICTLGVVNLDLFINNKVYIHEFHVLPLSINLSLHGIIGHDFLEKYKVDIKYKTKEILFDNFFFFNKVLYENTI